MAVIDELLRSESNGNISFGNHELAAKAKLEDYEHSGDMYKVKTFHEMTKLEKNGLFLYESVPGTSVHDFCENENGISFTVEGSQDAQITIGAADDSEYDRGRGECGRHEDEPFRKAQHQRGARRLGRG